MSHDSFSLVSQDSEGGHRSRVFTSTDGCQEGGCSFLYACRLYIAECESEIEPILRTDHFKPVHRIYSSINRNSVQCNNTNYVRKTFIIDRITHLWNKMPAIDLSLSVKTIRTKIYKVMWLNFINNFSGDNVCSFHFVCPCSRCHIK